MCWERRKGQEGEWRNCIEPKIKTWAITQKA